MIKLVRPLVFFDLETTGVNVASDRIVEISYIKLFPNGNREGKTIRVKPTMMLMGAEVPMHIPEGASAIHGIYDEDVADCPTFKEIAHDIANVLEGADIVGYNSNHFDVPLLAEEFLRVGCDVDLKRKHMVDAFTIFTKHEPRTLTAAYKFYCGKDLEGAHAAANDTQATMEVFLAQMEHYDDLPSTIEELEEYTTTTKSADYAGRIVYNEKNEEIFSFGKYKGQRVLDVFRSPAGAGYYDWMMKGDFPEYTKKVITRLYLGK